MLLRTRNEEFGRVMVKLPNQMKLVVNKEFVRRGKYLT